MKEFLAMGGYAAYVWPAYFFAAAIIGGLAIQTLAQWRKAQARLRALENDPESGEPKS